MIKAVASSRCERFMVTPVLRLKIWLEIEAQIKLEQRNMRCPKLVKHIL
jgi:hypothetical protein